MTSTPAVPRAVRPWLGPALGAAVLVALVARLGGAPFRSALAAVDVRTLAVTAALGAVTTTACAWRWVVLARRVGLRLGLAAATGDYYRAVFLNAVLPGGVLGDVHRAVRLGRDEGSVRRASVSVVVERAVGQVVLVAVGLVAVAVPGAVPWDEDTRALVARGALAVAVCGALGAAGWLVVRGRRAGRGVVAADLRDGAAVLAASLVAVAGFVATFVVAARAAGVTAPVVRLVPLVLLALLVTALPVNLGGWGPREGAAAWAFGAAGLGAAKGLEASVVFGVCNLVASLPGAVVLVARRTRPTAAAVVAEAPAPVTAAAPR